MPPLGTSSIIPTSTSTSTGRPARPQRVPFRLVGGPLHRATVWPPVGDREASWRIHKEVHIYQLDPATCRGRYIGIGGEHA